MAALAVSLTFFFPGLWWLAIIAVLAVVAARIVVGVHYVGDVLAGLVVGTLVAWNRLVLLQYLWPMPTT